MAKKFLKFRKLQVMEILDIIEFFEVTAFASVTSKISEISVISFFWKSDHCWFLLEADTGRLFWSPPRVPAKNTSPAQLRFGCRFLFSTSPHPEKKCFEKIVPIYNIEGLNSFFLISMIFFFFFKNTDSMKGHASTLKRKPEHKKREKGLCPVAKS
jgi:hypothetical protein